ncbi:YncE family protein [Rothia nasimurium]|uniref:YncE family protein n=1 Tax=Rothia nasimurium TaxID=85336 RepID=UPI001EFFF39E|nr:LPXTG cell wall anchor domain-containing protein [Rothia nasimurium]
MKLTHQTPRRTRSRFLLTGSATAMMLGALLVAPITSAESAFANDPAQNCTFRAFNVASTQYQGLPGQYQLGYSAANDTLWVTGSSGRPPIMTSTLAKVDPATMQITHTVGLNTASYSPRGWEGENPAGFQIAGAYGVGVDDVNGTVWVTNTRTNSVTAFDQTTMKQVFTTLGLPEGQAITTAHPREVRASQGKVFIGTQGAIVVLDGATYQHLATIPVSDTSGRAASVMNFALDDEAGLGYFPVFGTPKLVVVDLNTLTVVNEFALQGNDASANLVASDVTFDRSLNELYVSSQGSKGVNAGVGVYDKTTGAFKNWINFGTQGLSIDADEARDLVYATDLATGSYYVIDGQTDRIASTVTRTVGEGMGANDVVVTPHGVIGLERGTAFTGVEVPFTLDYKTGKYVTASTEIKGLRNVAAEGQPADWQEVEATPINAHAMTKFVVTDNGTVAGQAVTPAEAINSFEGSSADGAKLVVTNVSENGQMTLTGTGFTHPSGGGSVLGLLYDDRATQMNDGEGNVVRTIEAEAQGKFSVTLPVPTAENSNNAWLAGSTHRVRVLTGSLKDGDQPRSIPVEVTVAPAPQTTCGAPQATTVASTLAAFAGYGTFVDSAVGIEPTPAPSVEPTPAPSVEPTPVPSVEPTQAPSVEPTAAPSVEPTVAPSAEPSVQPTEGSTASPSTEPTGAPNPDPSSAPSAEATGQAGNGSAGSQQQAAGANQSASGATSSQVGASTQQTGKQASGGSLAQTGASVAALAGIGALALVAGWVVFVARRRAS